MTPARSGRRGLLSALGLVLLAAGLLAVAGGTTWARGTQLVGPAGVAARRAVTARGATADAAAGPLALVALASVGAVVALRGASRRVLGGLVAAAGVAVVIGTAGARRAAVHSVAGQLPPGAAVHTGLGGPAAHAGGGAVLALAGLLTLLASGRWPAMGGRFVTGTGASQPAATHGRDAGRAPARVNAPTSTGPLPSPPAAPVAAAAWSALDAGDDPTTGLAQLPTPPSVSSGRPAVDAGRPRDAAAGQPGDGPPAPPGG